MRRAGECRACGECCKTMRITGVLSHIAAQHGSLEEARAYYSFRKARITQIDIERDAACIEFDLPCDKLLPDNTCALHSTPELKPLVCHRYPLEPDDIPECGFRFE